MGENELHKMLMNKFQLIKFASEQYEISIVGYHLLHFLSNI